MPVGSQTVSRLISVTLLCLLAILLCRHHDRDNEGVHRWFHVIDRTGSTASPVPRLRSCRSGQSRAEKKLASRCCRYLVNRLEIPGLGTVDSRSTARGHLHEISGAQCARTPKRSYHHPGKYITGYQKHIIFQAIKMLRLAP